MGIYRISTIGDYYNDKNVRRTLGAEPDSWFETMVFPTSDEPNPDSEGCGCMRVTDWSEIDDRSYVTAGEAQAGHEEMVEKYLGLANQKGTE